MSTLEPPEPPEPPECLLECSSCAFKAKKSVYKVKHPYCWGGIVHIVALITTMVVSIAGIILF
jgi:hypothetical protein